MSLQRYSPRNFLVDPDAAFIAANVKELKRLSTSTYTVKAHEARRLDLISYTLYTNIELKWLLIYVNDIYDIDMVKEGTILRYPDLSDVTAAMMRTMEMAQRDR